MSRKRWTQNQEENPTLIKSREKRKWQIALRRYVIEKQPSTFYAPFFGLDIESLRNWVSCQFEMNVGWADFGALWQFEHVIPLTYFDFDKEEDLRLCWNFINIRVAHLSKGDKYSTKATLSAAEHYFHSLCKNCSYSFCDLLYEKVKSLNSAGNTVPVKQQGFLLSNKEYLSTLEKYSSYEFELLNSGRNKEEVIKEINYLKNF